MHVYKKFNQQESLPMRDSSLENCEFVNRIDSQVSFILYISLLNIV